MRKIPWLILLLVFCWPEAALSENLTVRGQMGSSVQYELREQVTVGTGVQKLVLSFVIPENFSSPTYNQAIADFDLQFTPPPEDKKSVRDTRGNQIVTASWMKLPDVIDVRMRFNALNETRLAALETRDPFPLAKLGPGLDDYLKATQQVQADDERIIELARKLTKGLKTEFDAVQQIISWVVDHVHYVTPPVRYDALYSLDSGKGNCQNYSHLAAALLRSVGIPVRIVNGVTLNEPFDVAWNKGVITFKMGQGRHSWIEVWFPDLGWVPFDPQNTELFVSNRFVRIEVGVDNKETKNDGLLRWVQARDSRTRPKLQETISADFKSDLVRIQGERQAYGPKNFLLCPDVKAAFKQIEVKPPPPPPVIPEPERKELRYEVPFVYGNIEFPEDVDFAFPRTTTASGADQFEMARNFLVETAEYVTTNLTQYAQVVVLEKPVKLGKIGLALHKFGGEGWLWVDIFQDDRGKPGAPLATSGLFNLDELSLKPGYRWSDFDFSRDNPILMPGSYWIALGFTGSPIVNWFYTYGKPVGPPDGTRYKGVYQKDWSGALGYEFNYRVTGLTVP
ncbi:MAG: transglutaminase domain-containing protein [Deltaproteobacteria bacterium]|nr:transglutaminase domain-containing protein [Deltaproteobacteria bacterium]